MRDVLGADRCRILAHDRGDSVVLLLHHRIASEGTATGITLEHVVLTNGNVFLPLANLTEFQKAVLGSTGKEVLAGLTPERLAQGMGNTTFTPPRPADDPTVAALASTFAFQDGIAVLHDTIQYLRERAEHEVTWLRSLASSTVPTTIIWGICDTVSPPRVAMHVWEHHLVKKSGSNEMWIVPGANHFLQNDRPDALIDAVVQSVERTGPQEPGSLDPTGTAPVRIDHSRDSLRSAAETFRT